MKISFGESLRRARIKNELSQQKLADMLFVTRSTIANWESGRRIPDYETILKLTKYLDTDFSAMIINNNEEKPVVIMVDNERIILNGGIPILRSVMPNAEIVGFVRPSEALDYARNHKIDLALLDIEMGMKSGLDVCRELLKFNPQTNVIYLTAYSEYSLDAWSTGASGFMLKPLTAEGIKEQLSRLRYSVRGLGD